MLIREPIAVRGIYETKLVVLKMLIFAFNLEGHWEEQKRSRNTRFLSIRRSEETVNRKRETASHFLY